MTTSLYFSRLTLRTDPSTEKLMAALLPREGGSVASDHKLIWSLFAQPRQRRDFLWRRERPGRYFTLSRRPPDAGSLVFDVETKPFEPQLVAGDRLNFALRVNATVDRAGRRHDVAMDLLHSHPSGQRADKRLAFAERAVREWMDKQGQRAGFRLEAMTLEAYRVERFDRAGAEPVRFGVFDLVGRLEVTEPASLLSRLAQGFGRARAFGCGLMLVRRVRP